MEKVQNMYEFEVWFCLQESEELHRVSSSSSSISSLVIKKERVVPLWSQMTRSSFASPSYFKMGLRYYDKPGIGYQTYQAIHPHVFQILGLQEHRTQGSVPLDASAGQWHTTCTLYSGSSPHDRHSCCFVRPTSGYTHSKFIFIYELLEAEMSSSIL